MITPKLRLFLISVLAWMVAVAVLGFLNMPKTFLPDTFAHAPKFAALIIDIWVLLPALVLALLALDLIRAVLGPWVGRGLETAPDRQRWVARTATVSSLFLAFCQSWSTLALVLLWRRHPSLWGAHALHGLHWGGVPDPHHLIPRLLLAAAGAFIAWFGNGLPKLLTPFRGGREPYDWSKMMRACGWAMTLSGLTAVACSLFIPPIALRVGVASLMTSCIAMPVSWSAYRIAGRHSGFTPPEGL